MKLLIIGGTGLLSGAVLKESLRQGIEVTIVNRGRKSKNIPEGTNVIIADYRNKELMQTALQSKHFDTVIDFICYKKEHIQYSIELLAPFCTQYIFISSACVYDYSKPGIMTEESDKVFKDWNYSVNKWESECFLMEQAQKQAINYTVIRPCITFDDSRIPYGMMPPYGFHWTFVERILHEKPIIRWNGGTTRWSMMRVEDFAAGLVGTIGNEKAYNQAFNICGDKSYSWNEIIECVEEVIKKKAVLYDISSDEYATIVPEKKERILGRSSDLICSNKKIKELIPDYQIKYTLLQGIEKTIEAYKQNNYQKGIDYTYDALEDRIIRKSCKLHDVNPQIYNLKFVDYLCKATFKDKIMYYSTVHNIKLLKLAMRRILSIL